MDNPNCATSSLQRSLPAGMYLLYATHCDLKDLVDGALTIMQLLTLKPNQPSCLHEGLPC